VPRLLLGRRDIEGNRLRSPRPDDERTLLGAGEAVSSAGVPLPLTRPKSDLPRGGSDEPAPERERALEPTRRESSEEVRGDDEVEAAAARVGVRGGEAPPPLPPPPRGGGDAARAARDGRPRDPPRRPASALA
jgi:hypothetical protein